MTSEQLSEKSNKFNVNAVNYYYGDEEEDDDKDTTRMIGRGDSCSDECRYSSSIHMLTNSEQSNELVSSSSSICCEKSLGSEAANCNQQQQHLIGLTNASSKINTRSDLVLEANENGKTILRKKKRYNMDVSTAAAVAVAADSTDDDDDNNEDEVYQDNNHNDNKNNNKSNLVKNSALFPNEFSTNINNGSGSSNVNDNKFSKYKTANAAAGTNESKTYLSRKKQHQQQHSSHQDPATNNYDDEAVYNSSSDFELDSKKELMTNESDASALNSKRTSNVSTRDDDESKSKSISNMSKDATSELSVSEKSPFLGGDKATDGRNDRTNSINYKKNLLLFESNLSSAAVSTRDVGDSSKSAANQGAFNATSGQKKSVTSNASAGSKAAMGNNKAGNNAKRKSSKPIYMDSTNMAHDYGDRHSSTLIDMHGLDANTTTRESQLANLNNIQTSDSLSTLSDKKKKVIVRIVTVFSVVFFLICFAMIAFTLRMSEKIDAQIRKSYMGVGSDANATRNFLLHGITIQPGN